MTALVGGLLVGCAGQAGQATMATSLASARSASSAVTATSARTTAEQKVAVPSLTGMSPEEATSALAAVGLLGKYSGATANAEYKIISQTPSASTLVVKGSTVTAVVGESTEQRQAREAAEAAAAAAAAAADADPASFQEIDERAWALVAKNPAAHIGEKYIIFGAVTQFDSATGPSAFRANTGAVQQENWYDYDVNTIVNAASAAAVADIVQDDLLKMYVKVEGAVTYDTSIGGSTTAPKVALKNYEIIGHDG